MTYLLRNSITGAFFNGTNFSEGDANKATRFDTRPDEEHIRLVWGNNIHIVRITCEQLAQLDESDELDRCADEHDQQARSAIPYVGAPKRAAATRLRKRATKLAVQVYANLILQLPNRT